MKALYQSIVLRVRNDSGSIAMFSVFVFFAMLLVGGLAVDMMRHENVRLRMQNTADRAVLAAASLRENPSGATPRDIAESYFAAEGLDRQLAGRVIEGGDDESGRTITVVPAATVPTLFMRILGINEFAVLTTAQATESEAGNAQIELVMVLDVSGSMGGSSKIGRMRDAAIDLSDSLLTTAASGDVAITIVPYARWVLPPAGFTNHFTNISGVYGSCLYWSTWTSIDNSLSQSASRNFCRTSRWRTMRPYLDDAATAAGHLNALSASGTTSIDLGVRNGALFFDPTLRPVITQMIADGDIDPAFTGRPYDWDETGVVRALVLLTDGQNCCGARYSTSLQDANTLSICTELKDRGVLIYSIAFQAPSSGASLMQACASSPSHYFNASSAELLTVFQGIGMNIQNQALRLTF